MGLLGCHPYAVTNQENVMTVREIPMRTDASKQETLLAHFDASLSLFPTPVLGCIINILTCL